MFKTIEKHRVVKGEFATKESDGKNGCFLIFRHGILFFCVISDRLAWEHVSISLHSRNGKKTLSRFPRWEEMRFIKSIFWDESDTVIQFHPSKDNCDDANQYGLHLWRPGSVLKYPFLSKYIPFMKRFIIPSEKRASIPPKELVGGDHGI